MSSLDSFEMNKATVATSTDNIAVLKAARALIGKAGFMKAKPEDVRGWMDKAVESAKAYGPRWQREMLLVLTETLLEQDGMGSVAVPYARKAERMMTDKDRPDVQKRTLELLANALERSGN